MDARWCAHVGLHAWGIDAPIPRGSQGEPMFPPAIAGSLTHTQGYRAALLGPSSLWAGLGVDAEPAVALDEAVYRRISLPSERELLAGWSPASRHVDPAVAWTVLFAAKEATYKAWFPRARRFLGFTEARCEVRDSGDFTSTILQPGAPIASVQGRWDVRGGYALAVAWVPA